MLGASLLGCVVLLISATGARAEEDTDPALRHAIEVATNCGGAVELRLVTSRGTLSDGRRVFHVRTVDTGMLAPRGNNYVLVISSTGTVDWSGSCSMTSSEVIVEGNRIYPQGKVDDRSAHVVATAAGVVRVEDERK